MLAALGLAAFVVLSTSGQELDGAAPPGTEHVRPAVVRNSPARVSILMGLPGDSERLQQYRVTVERLIDALADRGVPSDAIMVLFGDGSESMYPACTADSLAHELEDLSKACRVGEPVWLFLIGHANSAKEKVYFNIAGPDVSAEDLAKRLRRARAPGRIVIFLTTAGSGKFLQPLAAPGRILVSATRPDEEDNETEFPHALAGVLAAGLGDDDGDGFLSVLEIFRETKRRVASMYEDRGFVLTERAVLDGDGDGAGTARPASADADPARLSGFRLGTADTADTPQPPAATTSRKEELDHDDGHDRER